MADIEDKIVDDKELKDDKNKQGFDDLAEYKNDDGTFN